MTTDDRIQFRCIHCGAPLGARAEFAGKRGTCPRCSHDVLVPLKSEQEVAPSGASKPGQGAEA